MVEVGLRFLAGWTYRHYRGILVVSILLTAFCSIFVYRLGRKLETDLVALIPENYQSVKTLNEIKQRVGGVGSLVVLVQSPDFEANRRFAEDLARELQDEKYETYINFVDYKRDAEFYRKNALLFMETDDLDEVLTRIDDYIIQEKLKLSPLYISLDDEEAVLDFSDIESKYRTADNGDETYYTNSDRTILALEAMAAGTVSNIGFAKDMQRVIQQAVKKVNPRAYHPQMLIEYGGPFKNKIDEYDTILSDVRSTLIFGVMGIVALLTFYFRQPLAAFFVAIPLAMGLIWAFAITYWVIGNLNTMTAFLFVILFGLGIDFGIHMFARYLEVRMDNTNVQKSIETMLSQTGQAILTAAITTSIAFFSLTLTDFRGFSEFGFIVGTGIVMSLVSMTTVLPAVLVLADQRFMWIRMRHVWGHNWGGSRGHFPYPKLVIAGALLLTIYLGIHLRDIDFEYDFTNLRSNLPASVKVKQKMTTIPKYGSESQSYGIVLADSKTELDEIVDALEKKIAEDDPTPTIDKVKTLWTELRGQDEKLELIGEIRVLADGEGAKLIKGTQKAKLDSLRDLLDVKRLSVEDLPENLLRKFETIDGSQAYFAQILPSVQLRDGKNAIAFAEDSHEIQTASGKVFYSSSSNIIFADMLRLMLRDSPRAISLTVIVVFLILLTDFRSLRSALLVIFPLACGTVWMCGSLYLQDLKLNFYNMVALPTIIGMGIDNGVHLYHRYRQEGPGSMPVVIRSTGGAMFISMLTTMVGFFGLMMATHPGLNSIGRLALIGLLTCFVAAVLVLPAILEVLEGGRGEKKVK
ncbi:MAG: MMPL family transporter [Gemmatimonadetes bacterium]|nr:MMPL family transporter [Gemmatimonadota bacterium]MYK50854.1 MMPL family transporter [Gemmatimonadota bacterium]